MKIADFHCSQPVLTFDFGNAIFVKCDSRIVEIIQKCNLRDWENGFYIPNGCRLNPPPNRLGGGKKPLFFTPPVNFEAKLSRYR